MGTFRRLLAICLFAATSAFAQSADQEVVSVVDSPDPVTPGATLTYTITLTNHGPDPATNGGINVNLPGEVTYLNTVAPAGFSCSTFGAAVSCLNPSFAPGTVVFTMNVQVLSSLISFPDGSFNTTFSPSGTTPDPNNGNNSKTATTSYNTPQINMNIAVADSPDPVTPDNNITYTVDVGNSGPDAAQNATFNSFNPGTLQFQSGTQPTGWNCTFPSLNAAPTFTCQHTGSYASGATSQFIIVVKAAKAVLGVNDGSVSTVFSISGTGNETNNANNSETETTGYSTPDTDMAITATDSPDPVFPDGNITYTITVTNNGPDTATNANMSVVLNNTLLYQSITTPAGWSCPSLSAGHGASFSCTAASVAPATPAVFTLVLKAAQSQIGINDTTLNQLFTTSNEWFDTNNTNNQITVQTAYVTPDADVSITASDSPDPVAPDGNITYTVTVTNAGPDTAPNASMSVVLNNTLLWQSMVVPAGWNCPSLSPGHGASFSCTNTSFAVGSSVFTIVLKAAQSQIGINDTTLNQMFTVTSAVTDPNNANNTVTVQTTYNAPTVDLSTTNTDSPDPVVSGANITYTQSITNNGPDAATSVTFSQTLPSSVGFVSMTAPAGWSCTPLAPGASGALTCNAASLANAATANFTLVVKVLALSGTVTITTVPGSSAADPAAANNNATATTTINGPASADMSITKTTGTTNAAPGAQVTYTITLTNNGPHNTTGVSMTDNLPASLLFQSISAPAGFVCSTPSVGATGTISCTGGTVLNGASAVFTLVTTVAPGASGSIVNSASVASAQSDPSPGNSSSSASGVTVNAPSADLSISKTTAATSAVVGSNITYTIALTNNGPDTATTVTMTDALPASLLFQSITQPAGFTCTTPAAGASGTITCNAASLASGATATFTLVVRVANGASGSITNSASGASQTADPNAGNSSSAAPALPVSSSADLSIAKTTPATQAATGSTINYTITVTNAGPSPATSVVVTDTLPAGLQYVSATPSQGSCSGTTTITCTLGTINSGANATIALAALVTATSGSITNTAGVSAATPDPAGGNNEGSSSPVPVVAGAAIPTLSEWALIALGAMLAMVAMMRMRAGA